jgi:hypothetical protein
MKKIKFLYIITFIGIFFSCEKNYFVGVGEINTETRFINNYNAIEINNDIDVYIFFNNDKSGIIEIIGGEKLIPNVLTELSDTTLIIKNDNRINWIRNIEKSKIKIIIYSDSITYINYKGVGKLEFENTLKVNNFVFESWGGIGSINLKLDAHNSSILLHTGASDVTISGESFKTVFYSHTYGFIYALDYNVDVVDVKSQGTGDMYVSPIDEIGVTIDYLGNVYYKNNPKILRKDENNKGKLIKLLE